MVLFVPRTLSPTQPPIATEPYTNAEKAPNKVKEAVSDIPRILTI